MLETIWMRTQQMGKLLTWSSIAQPFIPAFTHQLVALPAGNEMLTSHPSENASYHTLPELYLAAP